MPFPHTLAGTIGFIVFVAFLFGIVTQSDNSGDRLAFQKTLQEGIQGVVESGNIFTTVFSTPGIILFLVLSILDYIAIFLSYDGIFGLPPEFGVFFTLVSITAIIAMLKWIRGVWDY